ncbi:anti-sigma factor [Sabulicella glaciei]|uniref:Regulator of SigK n=1 Tax=Sabulicella glaciei TaxID=2984948 RepID=A0ABT3NYE1_9PROT|nr:anti-sigma factor [Roseococcus sp. MDT2-1-1]MCW8087182.1 anti-sigma factor [Roseococcus sp. MDT2-1-1]
MTPEERDALAGEYVLGTLDAREAAALRARLASDPALREAVEAWERRLHPLAALAAPERPPPGLLNRIESTLDAARPRRRALLWPALTAASAAVAAGLALLLLIRPEPSPLMTVLLTESDQPAWLVEARGGAISLAAVNPRGIAPDRVAELWALPQGATAPTSLGLIPTEGRVTVPPGRIRPEAGMLIEITLEPPGGSPTGRPTGPILFIGRLMPARGT